MLITLKVDATEADISNIEARLLSLNLTVHKANGEGRVILEVQGDTENINAWNIKGMRGVQDVVRDTYPFHKASRSSNREKTRVRVGDFTIGGKRIALIAGPCAVESADQMRRASEFLSSLGVGLLRGGAYKPRTSPYYFQGLGLEGLKIIRDAADRTGMKVVSEVMESSHLEEALDYIDMIQIGARNMDNFSLLKIVGKVRKPVLLKRGPGATIEEFLLAAEYILEGGNEEIVLCERGIKTFETYSRYTLDLSAIPIIKELSHLPIVADPSHATGLRDAVPSMAMAAVAAGADGLLIEVHPAPDTALCDGAQSLYPDQFKTLLDSLQTLAKAVGREIELSAVKDKAFQEPPTLLIKDNISSESTSTTLTVEESSYKG